MASTNPDKTARREAARKKAESLRKEAADRERKQRLVIGAIATVLVALVGVAGFIIWQSSQRSLLTEFEGTSPAVADSHGGVSIGANGAGSENEGAVDVQVYLDWSCPACAAFEQINGADVKEMVDDGTMTVTYHPVIFLDERYNGHSLLAANAFLTVAQEAPEQALDFAEAMFQLEAGSSQNEDVVNIANEVGVPEEVSATFEDQTYAEWAAVATEQAQRDRVSATPTIIVDGTTLDGEANPEEDWSQEGNFRTVVEEAAG